MTSVDLERPAPSPGECGDDAEVSVLVEPGLPGREDDVELVDVAMGWLSGDAVALTAVADRSFDRLVECPLDALSDDQLRTVAAEAAALATRAEALCADVAGEIERRGHERDATGPSTDPTAHRSTDRSPTRPTACSPRNDEEPAPGGGLC